MITRNAFLGDDLSNETINKINEAIGDSFILEKGAGWTEEWYIHICTFDVDNLEIDAFTESHADVFEDKLVVILKNIDISYEISQY